MQIHLKTITTTIWRNQQHQLQIPNTCTCIKTSITLQTAYNCLSKHTILSLYIKKKHAQYNASNFNLQMPIIQPLRYISLVMQHRKHSHTLQKTQKKYLNSQMVEIKTVKNLKHFLFIVIIYK